MSEADVNQIRDEDVLRRMWQQTEDFGRKKEIRAHMYRLREERLRSLYSPDPAPLTKGCEISSGQTHAGSFADQTFQSMKSKEVRDAGSPPKEFTYRGQDLKEHSNAGWNVESEERRTEDGRTHVKSVNANIEGQYDVEGGRGQFAAVDRQRQTVSEYQDERSALRRDETSSSTAARDHVVRQDPDGTTTSSRTTSSNTSTKVQQVSATRHDTPPQSTPTTAPIHDYDHSSDINRNENVTRITNTSNYEQNLRSDNIQSGELISRKIDYPDDSTKVIVETRCLPDGTRVTSTRREFRVPVHSTRADQHTRSERKSFSSHDSGMRQTSSSTVRRTTDTRTDDIVDSQRHADDDDFKRQLREYTVNDDTSSETHRTNRARETKINKVTDQQSEDRYSQTHNETRVYKQTSDHSTNVRDDYTQDYHRSNQRHVDNIDQTDRREVIETFDSRNDSQTSQIKETDKRIHNVMQVTHEPNHSIPREEDEQFRRDSKFNNQPSRPDDVSTHNVPRGIDREPSPNSAKTTNDQVHKSSKVTDESTHSVTRDTTVEDVIERKTSTDHYQTTYQSDFRQKKVSNDLSPTHQAWASTLRADTPSTIHPSTRATSPGSRTFKSSSSSLRSSISPDKSRKPSSRGGSPSKVDRHSPSHSVSSDRYSSIHSTHSVTEVRGNKHTSPERKPPSGRSPTRPGYSPDRKPQDSYRQRPSVSPEKKPQNFTTRPSASPERKPSHKKTTDIRENPKDESLNINAPVMPSGPRQSPERPSDGKTKSPERSSISPEKKPTSDKCTPAFPRSCPSPDRMKPDNLSKKPEGSPVREVPTSPQYSRSRVSPDRKPGYMKPTSSSQPSPDRKSPKPGDAPLNQTSFYSNTSIRQAKEDHYKFVDEETKMNTRTSNKTTTSYVKAPSPTRKSPIRDPKDVSPKGRSPSPRKKTVIVTEDDELYGRIDKTVEETSIKNTTKDYPKGKAPSRETSPTKFGTFDKKKPRNFTEVPSDFNDETRPQRSRTSPNKTLEPKSPTKNSPSMSPIKSPSKNTRTDFHSIEKTIEEMNKTTVTKEHPRQLVTPSSSPTRKPKIETEPSTGASSPTTSVSGFVYFGSPRAEKPIVTDLDDEGFNPAYPEETQSCSRPETLPVQRSSSPSKIPCRSPSPEKRDSPTKETLPRKSSLKKPSNFVNTASPIDKPPTSFQVSPVEDKPNVFGHKVVKKDHPEEPDTSLPIKAKPPLTRRETYEDRCRLILGMLDNSSTTTENITKETKKRIKISDSEKSSPSVSPCDSPDPKGTTLFPDFLTQEKANTMKTDVIDFIANEKDSIVSTMKLCDQKSKNQPRDNSPTKLLNIVTKTSTASKVDSETSRQTTRRSPGKTDARPSESPERHPKQKVTDKPTSLDDHPEGSIPSKLPRMSVSPECKPVSQQSAPMRGTPEKKLVDKIPKESHSRTDYKITTSDQTTEMITTNENVQEQYTKITKEQSPRTRVLKSPSRQVPESDQIMPSDLPSRSRPAEASTRGHKSPDRPSQDVKNTRESPDKTPTCKITTRSSQDSTTLLSENTEEIHSTKTVGKEYKTTKTTTSPTRRVPQNGTRSVSPVKPSGVFKSESSPERKPTKNVPIKNEEIKDTPQELPRYMKNTTSTIFKSDVTDTANHTEKSKRVETIYPSTRPSGSPTRNVSGRTPSPTKSPTKTTHKISSTSPERKPSSKKSSSATTEDVSEKSVHKHANKTTKSVISKHETDQNTTESIEESVLSKTINKRTSRVSESPTRESPKPKDQSTTEYFRSGSPLEPLRKRDLSPEREHGSQEHPIDAPKNNVTDNVQKTSAKPNASPGKQPSYMKPTVSVISKHETMIKTKEQEETNLLETLHHMRPSSRTSPTRQSPENIPKEKSSSHPKSNEPKQLRTPSPTKKSVKEADISTDFLLCEREQVILDRVQKSLRKLSPERKEKSPSREKSPSKTMTSLQDLDITTIESVEVDECTTESLNEIIEEHLTGKIDVTCVGKPKDSKQKIPTKPSSRNVSPVKRAPSASATSKVDKSPELQTKSRSISPKKPVSHTDRPQSPQVPRAGGNKPRDHVPFIRKPTPATLSTYKIEKFTTDVKKSNTATKQNVTSKATTISATSRLVSPRSHKPDETETRSIPISKGLKEYGSPKKEVVTRTSSDSNIKPKKTSPQRIKSKPEIHVNDISTKSPKYQKPTIKEPHSKLDSKLATKPKSATALNTSTDDDGIIIDVQQSKSSRENSPDRICPTPVNFADDVGTPRFPDEVSEPDDDHRRHTYHTIHETESMVDDIVEICEDEELFVKKTKTEYDDSLLSVSDKVNKFGNKDTSVTKPKDMTTAFKDTERRNHSDFTDENLQSDECLLSVSEKVNRFAKGPRDTKDKRNPTHKITDEYDKTTTYQDDYTKLSVNDKAHLFVETAENINVPKVKPAQKVDRPDLTNVDESLKKDDCLLSVSDKVNKFVKTAENFLTETYDVEHKEKKIKEKHDKIISQIVDEEDSRETYDLNEKFESTLEKAEDNYENKLKLGKKESLPRSQQVKDYNTPNSKSTERKPTVKITTLRSSEAVKKAKAMFENIASIKPTVDIPQVTRKTTKLTDIGVVKKSPITDSTIVLHPSVEDMSPNVTDVDSEVDSELHTPRTKDLPLISTLTSPHHRVEDKLRSSPNRLTTQSPEVSRSKSPMRQNVEIKPTKTVLSRYPNAPVADSPKDRAESPRHRSEVDKHSDTVPGYLRPTKTSQLKEETKVVEDSEVSTRRGSGKFGVELRRTSIERSTVSSERRRSVDHHQPCIEDIFDLDLLEQMLEKVVGYEQRRRIRSQIRIVKNQTEQVDSHIYTKTEHVSSVQTKVAPRTESLDRQSKTPQRSHPLQNQQRDPTAPVMNGHTKEPVKTTSATRLRPQSPEKGKSIRSAKSPVRQPSPVKKRTVSPSKAAPKQKPNRFNEYASAYMKKVGLNEADKPKSGDKKSKKTTETKQTVSHETQEQTVQQFTTTKSINERTSSKDVIEIVQVNGKRSPSPEKITEILRKPQSPERRVYSPVTKTYSPERMAHSPVTKTHSPERRVHSPVTKTHVPERKAKSPERNAQKSETISRSPERKGSPERLYQRSPSPEFKRQKSDTKKETVIKTVFDIGKKTPSKPTQEEKPSWVTNRNLKKITSETRTFSTKKLESEKPKYRASSPSKVISKPTDVITSSYGPGPLDAEGKPLFGIKALRKGATNIQVKGTVIREEFHSRNGGEPEGSVSVTAYSSQPEDLQQLLAAQGAEPPSRIHGLSAITTTTKFGGDTGVTMSSVNTKEERASLEHFTHSDRKIESHSNNFENSFDTREETIRDSRKIDCTDRSDKREERVTEMRKGQREERREKIERRDDKKTVRQSSVKSLTEKFIKSANDSGKSDRSTYPKAGLILRTTTHRDSISSDEPHPGLVRTDSEHSIGSVEEVVVNSDRGVTTTTRTSRHHGPSTTHQRVSTTTHHEPVITTRKTTTIITGSQEPVVRKVTQGSVETRSAPGSRQALTEKSFLDSNTKVTGVQDILTRMKNSDIVIEDGDTTEDSEARALLNKFLGATVLMAGMQSYVDQPATKKVIHSQETVRTSSGGSKVTSARVEDIDLDQCWDERLLRKLLDECTDYEQRRRLRARIRTLMAEQEACASAVTDALGAANLTGEPDAVDASAGTETREEEKVTVTSSVRRDSSEKTVSSISTKSSTVIESMSRSAPKPVSPFAKFRQLEKQNSTNSPSSPKTPQSPGSPAASQPYFKFTDPALQCSALTIKERLLQWCRDKTRDYENVKLENFSTSWADGLAFCALVHHFLPEAFDYTQLTPDKRRHNFTLAFNIADEKAGIYPLLDVDDMVAMRKPDWKCVFTYVQSIYRRFKDQD